jgi:hypothetical protein
MLDGTIGSTGLLATLARQHTARCVAKLVEVMQGDDAMAAVEAARELLSRAYGQPTLRVEFGADGVTVELDTGTVDSQRMNGEINAAWR